MQFVVRIQICENFETIIIHALDAEDPEKVRDQINDTLRAAILEFSRK